MKYPEKKTTKNKRKINNNSNKHKQISKKTEKQKNKIKKHNNNNKYTNLHTIITKLFSLGYRRHYLIVARMTSTKKVYIPCLLGIIIT